MRKAEKQVKRQSAKGKWQSRRMDRDDSKPQQRLQSSNKVIPALLLLPFAFCALPFELFFRFPSRPST
jgi:hypothetical protein